MLAAPPLLVTELPGQGVTNLVWNRVVLLISGVALGWNLVHYMVAPRSRARRHLLLVAVAALVGVGTSAWLIPASGPGVLMVGLVVLLGSALVAYAGNAREVSKVEEPLARALPDRPAAPDARVAVLLVAEGEPSSYDGPLPWALRLQRREATGRSAPHWFGRPLAYARLRAAYERLPSDETTEGWLQGVAARLSEELGPGYSCSATLRDGSPSVASVLSRLAEAGHRRILVLAADGDPALAAMLRDEATRSRIRELGVSVSVLAPAGGDDLAALQEARLQALLAGVAPASLAEAGAPLVARAAAAVRAEVTERT